MRASLSIITLVLMLSLTSCSAKFSLGSETRAADTETIESLKKEITEKNAQIQQLLLWVQGTQNILLQITIPENIAKAFSALGYQVPLQKTTEPAAPQPQEKTPDVEGEE